MINAGVMLAADGLTRARGRAHQVLRRERPSSGPFTAAKDLIAALGDPGKSKRPRRSTWASRVPLGRRVRPAGVRGSDFPPTASRRDAAREQEWRDEREEGAK